MTPSLSLFFLRVKRIIEQQLSGRFTAELENLDRCTKLRSNRPIDLYLFVMMAMHTIHNTECSEIDIVNIRTTNKRAKLNNSWMVQMSRKQSKTLSKLERRASSCLGRTL